MNKRMGIVDLWKFIACILVMSHHVAVILFHNDMFTEGWIYVEFFFILTGYFTMKHFELHKENNLEEKVKQTITYIVKKFSAFLPYTISIIIMQYLIQYDVLFENKKSISSVAFFFDIFFDFLLIGDGNGSVKFAIWFLCAMLMAFPFFCMMCQMKSQSLLYMIAFFVSIVWCHYTDVGHFTQFPLSIVRAFIFLLLSALVYGLVSFIKDLRFRNCWKFILTVLEETCMLPAVYITFEGKGYHKFVVLCFVVALTLMLSGQTYSANLQGGIFTWLGEISMVIYITHWTLVLQSKPTYRLLVMKEK